MMKYLLVLISLIAFSPTLSALGIPFVDICKESPPPVREKVCYHTIKVSPNVVIVFKGGCDEIEHVGIIFNKNRRILQLDDDLDIISDQKLKNDEVFERTIEKTFPKSMWIDYKMYDEKDLDD